MTDNCEVLIIGAGPGGLACAKILAEVGIDTLVVERQAEIGAKVCAGGITWDGLINRVPSQLIERAFCRQVIVSNLQHTAISAKDPIIATVNRVALGQWMAQAATNAGARILTQTKVEEITPTHIVAHCGPARTPRQLGYRYLVGADGAWSLVRRSLQIPSEKMGLGLNYQLLASAPDMEWHLNRRLFGYGYGWIFPHANTVSIGAYTPRETMPAPRLKKNLVRWAACRGFDLRQEPCRAALINSDYRGFQFGNTFLVGDAAGLTSGLTGEGIYPAIISGEAVARRILSPDYPATEITQMVAKQKKHHLLISLAGASGLAGTLTMELLILLLRLKILKFQALEMTF